jgi:tRNA G46 methylase TrmB
LDSAALFPKVQPLEVELGCGDGSFLGEYAEPASGTQLYRGWNGYLDEFESLIAKANVKVS